MNSMTAFSRLQRLVGDYLLVWELKTVNHRFLDPFFRLPDALRAMEPQLRNIIGQYLSRGRIEISLQFKNQAQQLPQLNEEVLAGFVNLSAQLSQRFQIANDLTVSQCLNLPNVWSNQQTTLSDEVVDEILETFKQALQQLVKNRSQEGQAIQQLLLNRVDSLVALVEQIKSLTTDNHLSFREKIQQKLQFLTSGSYDEGRLEQELAFQLMRLDISEEIDRLETHLSEIKRVIDAKDSHGRRLDFLIQELHRETNTIGSKTDSKQVSQLTIDMKVYIEQMREQIQNVE
jgi:uncharacterized protein (TIGR00255 family)